MAFQDFGPATLFEFRFPNTKWPFHAIAHDIMTRMRNLARFECGRNADGVAVYSAYIRPSKHYTLEQANADAREIESRIDDMNPSRIQREWEATPEEDRRRIRIPRAE